MNFRSARLTNMKMSLGEGHALLFHKDCQCVRLIRNKMRPVSLFGHFETWGRVAFKRESRVKYIQNAPDRIQAGPPGVASPPPSASPLPTPSVSRSLSLSQARGQVEKFNYVCYTYLQPRIVRVFTHTHMHTHRGEILKLSQFQPIAANKATPVVQGSSRDRTPLGCESFQFSFRRTPPPAVFRQGPPIHALGSSGSAPRC